MRREPGKSTLNIGEKAPYFSLPATDGKIYSLSDFADRDALVVIFTCNHCPYAQAYEKRICEIAMRFISQGVGFVAICANDPEDYPEDSFENMIQKSASWGNFFPYLHDEKQAAAKAYDAACTPEAFLFNRDKELVYHGWIDDNYENPEAVTQNSLVNAIEAVLHNRTPEPQLTPVLGCSIKWKTD